MPTIHDLRSLLADRKATWSIATDVPDAAPLVDTAMRHHLGARPVPHGMSTTFMPRIRSAAGAPVIPRQPGVRRLLGRSAAGGRAPVDGEPSARGRVEESETSAPRGRRP